MIEVEVCGIETVSIKDGEPYFEVKYILVESGDGFLTGFSTPAKSLPKMFEGMCDHLSNMVGHLPQIEEYLKEDKMVFVNKDPENPAECELVNSNKDVEKMHNFFQKFIDRKEEKEILETEVLDLEHEELGTTNKSREERIPVFRKLAFISLENGMGLKGLDYFDKALLLDDQNIPVMLEKASMANAIGEYGTALEECDKVLQLQGDLIEALVLKADILANTGKDFDHLIHKAFSIDEKRAKDFIRKLSGNVPKTSKKIGRNEPCPCGSGKKYKKCCGRPDLKSN